LMQNIRWRVKIKDRKRNKNNNLRNSNEIILLIDLMFR